MSVFMRNYNGTYSIFVKENNESELVHSTKILAEANNMLEKLSKAIGGE